jgi:N-acetylneuraminic acid mutarotase
MRLPAGRSRAVALAIGSGILVCGGLTAGGTTSSILRIDRASGRISQAGFLTAPVHDAGGAVLNGSGFIFGGGRFGPGSTVQSVGATGHGASVGHLPAIRADLAAVTVGGKVVLVGGGTTTFYDRRVLTTIDGIHFAVVATLLVGVRYPAVATAGGLVYVIGGSTPSGDSTAIQAIDPRSGSVRLIGHLVQGLSHASAFVVGGTLFIAGGRTGGRAQDALLELDPTTGAVRQVGRLPYTVSDMAAVVIGTTGYLIGGETAGPVASIIAVSLP